jgi:glycosyltransferase involved in cell wall biosynthesis
LRHKLEQNEKYLLISFDYDSDFDRKNPELALEAYVKSEIYEEYGVKIRIVARNNSSKLKNLNKYRSHKGIEFVENHLSNEEYHEILLNAIALISTHRSEGYGLNLSEAMIMGTLVIATKYSGNLDFCDVEKSLLIKNKIVQTKGYSDSVYSRIPNAYWAEPSLSSAVKKIRYIFSNTEECELLVEKAFKFTQEHLTNEQLQLKMNKILEITQSRK